MIFWGPPGVGKTDAGADYCGADEANFINFSAVTSGIEEIRGVMSERAGTIAWVSARCCLSTKIHRFNKAQQDAFLPFVEKGQHRAHRCDDREPLVLR